MEICWETYIKAYDVASFYKVSMFFGEDDIL